MKKLAIVMALLIAAPLFAATMTWQDGVPAAGQATLTITPDAGEGNIVGIALEIDSDKALTIDSIAPAEMNIYMDHAWDLEVNGGGYTYGAGTVEDAKADDANPGPAADDMNFTISAGFLPGEAVAGPAVGATSVVIVLSATETASVDICDNDLRGGVVDVDGNSLAITCVTAQPLTVGSSGPACWDFDNQPCGDADGDGEVGLTDWGVFRAGFGTSTGDAEYVSAICADFDQDGEIGLVDWGIFRNFFGTTPATCP